jgi:hypothetical protein
VAAEEAFVAAMVGAEEGEEAVHGTQRSIYRKI